LILPTLSDSHFDDFAVFRRNSDQKANQPANTMKVITGKRILALAMGIAIALFIVFRILQDGLYL
jgi:hypothetical protein